MRRLGTVLALGPRRAFALALALALASPVVAATRQLAEDGTVHTISVEVASLDSRGGSGSGTRLVHTLKRADETLEVRTLLGTDDAVADTEPSITIDPRTNLPAVVWSRPTSAGYEIYAAFFDGVSWSTPVPVTTNAREDRSPQAKFGATGLLHIVWNGGLQPDLSPALYEAVLDSKGLILMPAALVRAVSSGSVVSTSPTGPIFFPSDVVLVYDASNKFGGRIVCLGGQDEPIPVDRRVDFVNPSGFAAPQNLRVEKIGTELLVMYRSGTRLVYSVQTAEGFTPLRWVTLDTLTEDQAELLIRSMVAKLEPLP